MLLHEWGLSYSSERLHLVSSPSGTRHASIQAHGSVSGSDVELGVPHSHRDRHAPTARPSVGYYGEQGAGAETSCLAAGELFVSLFLRRCLLGGLRRQPGAGMLR